MDIIYLIEDSISGLKYLGSKKNWRGDDTYWGTPCCKYEKHKKYKLQQQWAENFSKHKETFTLNILEEFDDIDQKSLLQKEKMYQKTYNVLNDETFINACYAGGTGFMGSGESNPMYGKKHSTKAKQNMSIKQKKNGKIYSILRTGKTNEELWGKETADKANKKLSNLAKARVGEKNPFYGKRHTDETKKIISKKLKGIKPVNTKKIFIDGQIYSGLNAAFKATGIKPTTIWHRIHSHNKKYINFKYV